MFYHILAISDILTAIWLFRDGYISRGVALVIIAIQTEAIYAIYSGRTAFLRWAWCFVRGKAGIDLKLRHWTTIDDGKIGGHCVNCIYWLPLYRKGPCMLCAYGGSSRNRSYYRKRRTSRP